MENKWKIVTKISKLKDTKILQKRFQFLGKQILAFLDKIKKNPKTKSKKKSKKKIQKKIQKKIIQKKIKKKIKKS